MRWHPNMTWWRRQAMHWGQLSLVAVFSGCTAPWLGTTPRESSGEPSHSAAPAAAGWGDDAKDEHPPRPALYHRVQPGDTVKSIAQTYGVDVARLVQDNQLEDHSRLKPGQQLHIPDAH
ncbi:MAG: LysM peptidoglycan-binding domain-containing protein [Planctomycetales bacterium]